MTDNHEYFSSEDFKEILRQYEESVKSGERIYMDADDLADIADYYHYSNRPAEAEQAISLAMEINPDAVGPILYKAREALNAKDYETAEQYAEKVQSLDALEAVYLQAEILVSKEDTDSADKLLKQYFQDVPDEDRNDFCKGVVSLYLDYDQFYNAFEWLALITDFKSVEFKETLARTLFGIGNFSESEKIFNELLDNDPYSATYWNALAGIQYINEDYAAALTSCDFAIAIDPNDVDALHTKGNILFSLKNYEEAIEYLQKYIEKRPEDATAYLHLAACYNNKGQLNDALKNLQKAASICATDSFFLPEIYQDMALVYNTLGQMDQALWCLDMTDKLDCNHFQFAVIKGHILLANKLEEKARQVFDDVLEASGNDPNIQLRIIISYQDNNKLEYAYKAYKEFFKAMGNDYKEGYSYMALCCRDLNNNDEALYYLKKACDCNPEEAKDVLGSLFPEDLSPKDYYDYIQKHPLD